jgi:mRNA interferase RelE/StbE
MAWKIEFERSAERELEKLGHEAARRILRFLHDRVARIGEALSGATLGAFWRYRVGNFRIIANIDDKTVRIVVIRVGNRREIYP